MFVRTLMYIRKSVIVGATWRPFVDRRGIYDSSALRPTLNSLIFLEGSKSQRSYAALNVLTSRKTRH